MIRGVIFDLGGTLAALAPALPAEQVDRHNAAGLLAWLRQRGWRVDDEFVDALVMERLACFARRVGDVEIPAAEALRPVLQRYRLPDDESAIAAAEAAFFQPELASMRALPGAQEILRHVQALGLRAGLASNASSHYFVTECCRRLSFTSSLDPIVSSAGIGRAKPDRLMFETIVSGWAVEPAQVIMVGDTPSADVVGANRMGMRSLLISRTSSTDPDLGDEGRPDAVAAGLVEAARFVEQWVASTR
jgi:FMN phosphatase YigB (HAD superfamily)